MDDADRATRLAARMRREPEFGREDIDVRRARHLNELVRQETGRPHPTLTRILRDRERRG